MKRILVILSVLVFLGTLPQTKGAAWGAESYYPLKAGMTWEYTVTSDKSGTKKVIIKNLAPQKVDDKTVTPVEWNTNGRIAINFVVEDDSGVYKIAEQRPGSTELIKISPPTYYLKYPISEESSWDTVTKMGGRDIQLSHTIYSVSDTITVPAGTFKDCVKIKNTGTDISKDKDDISLSLEAFEWYAPGVGCVKSMATIKKQEKNKDTSTEIVAYQLESLKK
jgi:hypothetical protein